MLVYQRVLQLENSFHSPVYQALHPLRLLQEYQVGSCLVQFLNDEVAPASPVLDESHFPCGKKNGIFGHTNCHFNRENMGKKTDLYGFKNFQTLSFRRKNWMFHDLEPIELSCLYFDIGKNEDVL